MTETSPAEAPLFGLAEALRRLGCGRTWFLGHLAKHPWHDGQPTHRRIAGKIMFTEQDFTRLLDSMAPVETPTSRRSTSRLAPPSASRDYEAAMKLVAERKQRRSRRSE